MLKIEKVDRFIDRFSPTQVARVDGSETEISPETLPTSDGIRVLVFEQAR